MRKWTGRELESIPTVMDITIIHAFDGIRMNVKIPMKWSKHNFLYGITPTTISHWSIISRE